MSTNVHDVVSDLTDSALDRVELSKILREIASQKINAKLTTNFCEDGRITHELTVKGESLYKLLKIKNNT